MHRAFKALSLIVHPDHSVCDELVEATEKFQVLVEAHDFLMCEENRKIYDDTGRVDAPFVIIVSDEDYQSCKRSYEGTECFFFFSIDDNHHLNYLF